MNSQATQLPTRRPDLIIRPIGEKGRYVVKNPVRRDYFELGEQEHFLLSQLDGERTAEEICQSFERQFDEPLDEDDLDGFLQMARGQGLLVEKERGREGKTERGRDGGGSSPSLSPAVSQSRSPASPRPRQSILYWRKSFFDPDRLFNWLEPKIRFFWTRGFLVFSAACIVLAAMILWTGRQEAAGSFTSALRWETALLIWLTLLLVTTLHEFAHGLTCKHYGGEVHEIGFLLMFFMPCFYCNVSDAWLFREKSKRLWVTFAGGYFELFVWALAVFVWRLTVPDSLVNYLAFVVLAVCGVGSFFNFNPLIKLDGYYLLSDMVEIPNLRQRAVERLMQFLRWMLWGAAKPTGCTPRGKRSRFLLGFGIASWVYSLMFLGLMIFAMSRLVGSKWGPLGFGAVAVFGVVTMKGLFKGISSGEAKMMILNRHKRTAGWGLALGLVAAVLGFGEIEDRVGGPCRIRSEQRAEVRAPAAGFLREIAVEEGDRVSAGSLIARLEIPDLESRLRQKQAEVREAEAELRLLEIGPSPKELAEQRQRVKRAEKWRDLARDDLLREQQALREELEKLDGKIAECRTERDAAQTEYARREDLFGKGALSEEKLRDAERQLGVCRARLRQAEADRRARKAIGTLQAEAELARREKELADARSTLALLEAGTRPEEIAAAESRWKRLQEEHRYLQSLRGRLAVSAPAGGRVTTPHLKEQQGRYLAEGELICTLEETAAWEVSIALPEESLEGVRLGQAVTLKARGLPYKTFRTRVTRIAPAAGAGETKPQQAAAPDTPTTVTVSCRLAGDEELLRPGMTGYARISTGRRPIGAILGDRVVRFLRTEFWW